MSDLITTAEAKLRYGDGDFTVLENGDFVRCAVTGRPVKLATLRYWSVSRQEAYADAEAANRAFDEAAAKGEAF